MIEYWQWQTLRFGAETYRSRLTPTRAGTSYSARAPRTPTTRPAPGTNRPPGVRYDEFSNLTQEVPLRAVPGGPLAVPAGATATHWIG